MLDSYLTSYCIHTSFYIGTYFLFVCSKEYFVTCVVSCNFRDKKVQGLININYQQLTVFRDGVDIVSILANKKNLLYYFYFLVYYSVKHILVVQVVPRARMAENTLKELAVCILYSIFFIQHP